MIGSRLVMGHVPTHPFPETSPDPTLALSQTLDLTQGKVGTWPATEQVLYLPVGTQTHLQKSLPKRITCASSAVKRWLAGVRSCPVTIYSTPAACGPGSRGSRLVPPAAWMCWDLLPLPRPTHKDQYLGPKEYLPWQTVSCGTVE